MRGFIRYHAMVALAAMALSGDTLTLRDGRVVHGTFLGGTANEIRFREEGRTQALRYALRNVSGLSFGNQATTSAAANTRPAQQDSTWRQPSGATSTADVLVPAGTVATVRLIDPINSDKNDVGETFRAALDEPLVANGRTVAPAGADATVRIVRVDQGRAISGSEEVAIQLAAVSVNGRMREVRSGDAVIASKAEGSQNLKVIGGTAVVGAIIGAIAGGGKGAAIGAASGAGAGAAIQAIRGQRVQIPSEAKLDFTLNEPIYRR